MSLTPEQEAHEREMFESHCHTRDLCTMKTGDWYQSTTVQSMWHGYLARAEVAAKERKQLMPYMQYDHKPNCRKWQNQTNTDTHTYGVCTCGLDAILAPREKGDAK